MVSIFKRIAESKLDLVETPEEVMRLTGMDSVRDLMNCPDTMTCEQIRQAVKISTLGKLEGRRLYYPLDDRKLMHLAADVDDCGIDDVEEGAETHTLILDCLTNVQKVVADVLREQGNKVYTVSPASKNRERLGKNGNGWLRLDGYWHLVVKELNGKAIRYSSPFYLPEDENLVDEEFRIVEGGNGSKAVLTFAPDYSDVPDFSEANLNGKEGIKVIIDAMRACVRLHENDFVHRDIKPENILVFPNGGKPVGKLCDHEMVAPEGVMYRKNKNGSVYASGTAAYMDICYYPSYEAKDILKITASSDVFAFGITLLEYYLEHLMKDFIAKFQAAECKDINMDVIREFIKHTESDVEIPERVLGIIVKMLKYDRSKRPRLKSVIRMLERV